MEVIVMRSKLNTIAYLLIAICLMFIMPLSARAVDCLDISDVPLETRFQAAAANVMFVLDDSGSMDWEFLTSENDGLFGVIGSYGQTQYYRYLFDNPGDNLYSGILPDGDYRMKWYSQWSDYNKMYYDPSVDYEPWPTMTDADPDTPLSHPMRSSYTFDLSETYQSFSTGASSIIVDNQDSSPDFVKTPEANPVIIDDSDSSPAFVKTGPSSYWWWWGGWQSKSDDDAYKDYYSRSTSDGDYTATWTPNLTEGTYDVYAMWGSSSYLAKSVTYTITYDGGSDTVTKDQEQNGGTWVPLGTYPFAGGTGGNVTLTFTHSSKYEMACADAVKFVPTGAAWDWATHDEAHNSHYYWTPSPGDYTATWTPDIPSDGAYEVRARWVAAPERSENVTYTITHAGGSDTVSKSQRLNGGEWVSLGTYSFNAGTGGNVKMTATVTDTSQDTVCADAIEFLPGSLPPTIDIKRAHYYIWSDIESKPYLVVLDGDITYYEVSSVSGSDSSEQVTGLMPTTSPPSDVQVSGTYTEARQNFANWYQFYRARELTATASVAKVIASMQGVQIGIRSINGNVVEPVRKIKVGGVDETGALLNTLFGLTLRAQGTPLRNGLKYVGQYFHQDDGVDPSGLGASPYASQGEGGACQQAFAIVMTDGYYTGYSPSVGNQDKDEGAPYADSESDTLADVAMKYYKEDLSDDLDDLVPISDLDDNSKQHMVTYSVSFGVTGTLDPDDYDFENGIYPTWTDPDDGDQEKIDDLWHASVNGRGTFLSASRPDELVNSLISIMQHIESRIASASAVSVNGDELYERLGEDILMFQASYNSDGWTGDVRAYEIDTGTGDVITTSYQWSARDKLEHTNWDTGRIIATYNGTSGTYFRYGGNLSATQKTQLNSDAAVAENILNYLRGDASNEEENGGAFRDRYWRLGDLVHSSPVFNNDILYAGGNDGMLHAFSADTGEELFAYVPNLVFENLSLLADPAYTHQYYVDLTPAVKYIPGEDKTILVGGLGKGGKGYYALDVTSAASITTETELASRVLWEYGNDDDLGYTYSKPMIVDTNDSSAGHAVIFGNGYSSVNESAVLYVLDPMTGAVIIKIDTGVGSCNGLSSPVAIDVDMDEKADYVYAGDLHGNLWKFDFTAGSSSSWDVAYKDSSGNPQPLFQAKHPDAAQPITAKPDVMRHCEKDGYIVLFATGSYLGETDVDDTSTQTIYGIWDYGDDEDNSEYLGSFERGSTPQLSNQPSTVTLLAQTRVGDDVEYNGQTLRVLSDNEASWVTVPDINGLPSTDPLEDPSDGTANHAGWYFDMPGSGERVVVDVMIRDDIAIAVSYRPESSPCGSGGYSMVYEIDACTGARLQEAQFDINGDGVINKDDLINIEGDPIPPSGLQGEGQFQKQVILRRGSEEVKYFSSSSGTIEKITEKSVKLGITSWREYSQ
jgi:type IV pilus assembly protein PilY1